MQSVGIHGREDSLCSAEKGRDAVGGFALFLPESIVRGGMAEGYCEADVRRGAEQLLQLFLVEPAEDAGGQAERGGAQAELKRGDADIDAAIVLIFQAAAGCGGGRDS